MDRGLVIKAQSGDHAAFATITDSSYGRLQQVAYRILRDPQLAEDATQQAFIEIWLKLPRLRDPSRFEAWAYRTLVRMCYRESKRRRRLNEITPTIDPVGRDELGAVGEIDELERAFRRLNLDQRTVIVLHHYLGLTVEQIADALDIPFGTAASRLGRGMAKLRKELEKEQVGPSAASQEPIR